MLLLLAASIMQVASFLCVVMCAMHRRSTKPDGAGIQQRQNLWWQILLSKKSTTSGMRPCCES